MKDEVRAGEKRAALKTARLPCLLLTSYFILHTSSFCSDAVYTNDFQSAELTKVPADFMVMSGGFAVGEEGTNRFLELPGAPLETFGLLFGPVRKDGGTALARFFGTRQGRKFPGFGISLGGVGGYRLQASPAKKALEIFKGDEPAASVPFEWVSAAWTRLRIQVRATPEGLVVEGKAWPDQTPEPKEWTISFSEKSELPGGRAGIWGSPYSGTPIRFDDLFVGPVSPEPLPAAK